MEVCTSKLGSLLLPLVPYLRSTGSTWHYCRYVVGRLAGCVGGWVGALCGKTCKARCMCTERSAAYVVRSRFRQAGLKDLLYQPPDPFLG